MTALWLCSLCGAETRGTAEDALDRARVDHPGLSWLLEATPDGPLIVAVFEPFPVVVSPNAA